MGKPDEGMTHRLLDLFPIVPQDAFDFGCLRGFVEYLLDASSTEKYTQPSALTFLRNPIFSSVLSAVHILRTVSRVL